MTGWVVSTNPSGRVPISAASGFQQAGTAGYTWQQVQSLLAGTDPGAISAAGTAYGQLAGKLTDIASKVSSLGQTLAGSFRLSAIPASRNQAGTVVAIVLS